MDIIDISDDSDVEILEVVQSSQATDPPSSQADILDITDSEDDTAPATPKRKAKATTRRAYSPLPPSSPPALYDSDEEFPSLDRLLKEASSPSKSISSSPRKRERSNTILSDRGEPSGYNPRASGSQRPSPKKKRRTAAEVEKAEEEKKRKALERAQEKERKDEASAAEKARKRDEAARVKEAKALERERNAAEKDRLKKQKKKEAEQEKANKTAISAANRLVANKSDTLPDMTVIFSTSLQEHHSGLISAFREHPQVSQLPPKIAFSESYLPSHHTIRFTRHWEKQYNAMDQNWRPCAPIDKPECIAVLYMSVKELMDHYNRREFGVLVQNFRELHGLTLSRDKTFIILHGNVGSQVQLDKALAELQVIHHVHVRQPVKNYQAAAQRLYDLTADLGIRPYKLIERSHLPFCGNVKIPMSKEPDDIFKLMINQVYRVTDAAAMNVVKQVKTMNTLYSRYENSPDPRMLLKDVPVGRKVDGTRTDATLGQALSTRIHTVLCGTDPLQLVVNDKQ